MPRSQVDPEEDINYSGQSTVSLTGVPEQCTAADVRTWMRAGLGGEDAQMKRNVERLQKLDNNLKVTERRLEMVPFMNTASANFEESSDERKKTAMHLSDAKKATEKKMKALQEQQKMLTAGIKTQPIELYCDSHDEKRKIKTWFAKFRGKNAEVLGHRCVHKKNWYEITLSAGFYPDKADPRAGKESKIEAFACVGDLPVEYLEGEVKMRGVRVRRLMHGEGTFVYGEGDVYKGKWHMGHAQGHGKSFQVFGNYEGEHLEGHKSGTGTFTFANGDRYTGEVGHATQHEASRIEGLEYCFGNPHGVGTYMFADGSKYEGEFYQGNMTGKGKYTGSDGEIQEGRFAGGVLEGPGKHITAQGARYEGLFERGSLHHKGTYSNPRRKQEMYAGDWDNGLKHGYGHYRFSNGDNYFGYFDSNVRQGRGVMEYGNVEMVWDSKLGKDIPKFDYRYEGEWRVGKTRARGTHTSHKHRRDDKYATSSVSGIDFTTNGKSKRYPRLFSLPLQEAIRAQKERKRLEEALDGRKELRETLHRQALHRFRKQRHFATRAIDKQLNALERQKKEMEKKLRAEMLVRKRKQREKELRDQRWGGDDQDRVVEKATPKPKGEDGDEDGGGEGDGGEGDGEVDGGSVDGSRSGSFSGSGSRSGSFSGSFSGSGSGSGDEGRPGDSGEEDGADANDGGGGSGSAGEEEAGGGGDDGDGDGGGGDGDGGDVEGGSGNDSAEEKGNGGEGAGSGEEGEGSGEEKGESGSGEEGEGKGG